MATSSVVNIFPMPAPKFEVEVIYRGSREGGTPFVLMPTLYNGGGDGHCASFYEAGGMTYADLVWSMENSRPATPEETIRLRDMLRERGFALKEVKRSTERMAIDRKQRMRLTLAQRGN